jgi:transaldolase
MNFSRINGHYGFKTKVLAAALKSQAQVLKVVGAGADAITVNPEVCNACLNIH